MTQNERVPPDLNQFTDTPEAYLEMHRRALRENDYPSRVMASWGLIAQGERSAPILLELLRAPAPESRETQPERLVWLGESPGVVEALCEALPNATTHEARGFDRWRARRAKSRKAIPVLAGLIRLDSTDEDTQWTAVQALGTIVRRRFDRQSDPRSAAIAWLDAHPTEP